MSADQSVYIQVHHRSLFLLFYPSLSSGEIFSDILHSSGLHKIMESIKERVQIMNIFIRSSSKNSFFEVIMKNAQGDIFK